MCYLGGKMAVAARSLDNFLAPKENSIIDMEDHYL